MNDVTKIIILFLTGLLLSGWQNNLYAQPEYTLSGYVRDASGGDVLAGATVSITGTHIGTITNADGFYSLQLKAGNYSITFSFLGYQEKTTNISIPGSLHLNIQLSKGTVEQKEVLITDKKETENVDNAVMGRVNLQMKHIEELPALFGEVDVLKALQLLPGVNREEKALRVYTSGAAAPDRTWCFWMALPFIIQGICSVSFLFLMAMRWMM